MQSSRFLHDGLKTIMARAGCLCFFQILNRYLRISQALIHLLLSSQAKKDISKREKECAEARHKVDAQAQQINILKVRNNAKKSEISTERVCVAHCRCAHFQ